MTLEPPLVLVDATTLRTSGGRRGLGRMGFDLLHGLAETRDEWASQLAIHVVTHFDFRRGWMISSDLATAADTSLAARNTVKGELPLLRRTLLGHAARATGAHLLHLIDPDGTPLFCRIPLVTTCHDLVPLRFAKRYLGPTPLHRYKRWLIDRRRYGRPARVIAISQRTCDDLIDLLQVPRSQIDVVSNGVDLGRWRAGDPNNDRERRRRLGVGTTPYVFFAGHCDYKKNVRGMIEALKLARRRIDLHLVLAGDMPSAMIEGVRARARKEGVGDAVKLLGYVDDADLPALYRGASALLFLSHLEGFGLPVAEAMAAGCPVIVPRGSGSDEVGGNAAVLVGAGDSVAAADAMVRLVIDPIERQRYLALGQVRAEAFDRRTMARGYVASYCRALARLERACKFEDP